MARTIRVADIGDYASQQMEKLLRVAVLETDSRLKQASPVDTGRFRVSWQVGENSTAPPPDYYGNEGGPNVNIPPLAKLNYRDERLGNVYSVHNNLPYAEPLANGSSRQAPAGWIQGVAKDIQVFVQVNADRIGRES
jgi:hypothetical protein